MPGARRFVFAIVAILLPLIALETGIRLYDLARGASTDARTSWYWGFTQDRLLGYRARPDVDITYAGGTNHLDTNSQGFRDREFDPETLVGKRVVIVLGESSTWGTGSTSRDTTWPRQLDRLLAARDPRFVVLNAGMPGYTLVENVQLLNLRLLKYHPEAVVYMGLRNDVEFYARSLTEDLDLNFYPRQAATLAPTWLNSLVLRSALLGLLVTKVGVIFSLDAQGVNLPQAGEHLTPRGAQTVRDQIALMSDLTTRHGARLFWVDQPIDYSKTTQGLALEEARAVVRDEVAKNAIPLLDAHGTYSFKEFPTLDDVHLTDGGNRHLAGIVAPQLLRLLDPP